MQIPVVANYAPVVKKVGRRRSRLFHALATTHKPYQFIFSSTLDFNTSINTHIKTSILCIFAVNLTQKIKNQSNENKKLTY